MTTDVRELALIASLTRGFTRSPRQLNRLQESDAELLRLDDGLTLALTTDTIAEEIASGLYADPWLAGWMLVMANFSDIAAVGAEPLGILIAETFPDGMDPEAIAGLQKGIQDACVACGSWVLGGDTNAGDRLLLTGTAVGTVRGAPALTRVGIFPGDSIYCTGPVGGGNAFAAARLAGEFRQPSYRPAARLREGQVLRGRASACMDTSDGLLTTLDQLGRLNDVGFELHVTGNALLGEETLAAAKALDVPAWLFLAGPHGEFELVFALSPSDAPPHRAPVRVAGRECRCIGTATEGSSILIPGVGSFGPDHRAAIRDLDPPDRRTMRAYIEALCRIGASTQDSTAS